jgi:hypothetical protein
LHRTRESELCVRPSAQSKRWSESDNDASSDSLNDETIIGEKRDGQKLKRQRTRFYKHIGSPKIIKRIISTACLEIRKRATR